jgi:hypothetical protein
MKYLIFVCAAMIGCARYDIDMRKSIDSEQLQGTGSEQLQGTDSEQLQGTGSEQLQGTDSEQLQGTDSEQLQGTDSEQLQGTDSEQLQGTDSEPECLIDDGLQNPHRESFLIEVETAPNPDANGQVLRCFANSDLKNFLQTGSTAGTFGLYCQIEKDCEKPGDCDCAIESWW